MHEKGPLGVASIFSDVDAARLAIAAEKCARLPADSVRRKKTLDTVIADLKLRYPYLFRQEGDDQQDRAKNRGGFPSC